MRERGETQTDWNRLESLSDDEIDTSDIPELDEDFWKNANVVIPKGKVSKTFRIDADVLEWFMQEKGYQTKINAVLRSYYEAHKHSS